MSTINIPSIDSLRPEYNKIRAIQALYNAIKDLISGGISKDNLAEDVQEAIDKAENAVSTPEGAGSPGQVLQLDNEGVPSWATPSAGTVPDVELDETSTNAVQNKIITKELLLSTIYDVSAHNSNATFASLSALLSDANLATLIPTTIRRGGMQIRFVQSSDNKYVQYRLMADTFSTTESDWQGVDDEPTAGSNNLIKSGGVYNGLSNVNDKIGTEETFTYSELCGMRYVSGSVIAASGTMNGIIIPLIEGVTYDLLTRGVGYVTFKSLPAIGVTSNIGRVVTTLTTITVLEGEKYILANVIVGNIPSVSVKRHEMNLSKRVSDLEASVDNWGDAIEAVTEDITDLKKGELVITKMDVQEFTNLKSNNFINTNLASMGAGSTGQGVYCAKIPVVAGQRYKITGLGGGAAARLWSTADSDSSFVRKSDANIDARTAPVTVIIEEGESYLGINLNSYDATTDKVEEVIIEEYTTNDLKEEIEEMQGDTALLKTKKIVSFGDSVWEFTDGNGKGIIEYLKEYTGNNNIYKGAIGGSRLVVRRTPVENPTDAYGAYAELDISYLVNAWATNNWTAVDNAVAWLKNNTSDDNSAIIQNLKNCPIAETDVVLIAGGGNDSKNGVPLGTKDSNDESNTCGALAACINSILSVNPKIQIFYMSPLVRYVENTIPPDAQYWSDTWENNNGVTLAEASDTLIETAKYHHIPSINLYWELGWNQTNFFEFFYTSDLTHPYKGFKRIAQKVYTYLCGNI